MNRMLSLEVHICPPFSASGTERFRRTQAPLFSGGPGPRRDTAAAGRCAALLGAVLAIASTAAPALAVPAAERAVDASGLPLPAWQSDPELAAEWRRLTGRYIFQRACVDCHQWGPEHLSRAEWEEYLAAFPANHEPDVRQRYSDLTAQFLPGRMVPNADQRSDALATFLLAAAPAVKPAQPEGPAEPAPAWDGLPRVGDPVPDFSLTDLAGRQHSPAAYRGEQHLVLVFSRAHW